MTWRWVGFYGCCLLVGVNAGFAHSAIREGYISDAAMHSSVAVVMAGVAASQAWALAHEEESC